MVYKENQLYVGVGREIITPKVGGNLFGYRPDIYSETIHDDLTVSAIAFIYNDVKAILISATVCLIDDNISDELRKLAGKNTDTAPENVILCATHTHSAPPLMKMRGWGDIDRPYYDEIFKPGFLKAVQTAVETLTPVQTGMSKGHSTVGINRRQLLHDDTVVLGQNPWGLYDPNMTVISFRDMTDKPIANLVHFGAHLTATGADPIVTRDWAGVMTDRLDFETGAISVYINGAQGDVAPRISCGQSAGEISYMREIGALAALDAVRIYKDIHSYKAADCDVATGEINIPYMPMIPLKEAENMLIEYESTPDHNIGSAKHSTLKEVVELHKKGLKTEENLKIEQTVLRIGDAVIVPMPYEVSSEISMRLRAEAPHRNVLLTSCANGSKGYLPTFDQMCRGGYEVEVFRWLYPHRLPDNADNYFINQNLQIINQLP
jgi:hypothetical protein